MQQKLHQKEQLKKTAEATGDLIGKITSVSKKSATELNSKELHNNDEREDLDTIKKRYIPPEKRKQFIEELS